MPLGRVEAVPALRPVDEIDVGIADLGVVGERSEVVVVDLAGDGLETGGRLGVERAEIRTSER